uniref:LRAT domain-containing protein n=1 Tax=Esox lucius TaxID=8010 RepID=A0A3P8YKV9_ESOLU
CSIPHQGRCSYIPCIFSGHSITTSKPQPGDLIEIFRGTYQHWALYVGEGYIVHLCPPTEAAGAGAYSLVSVLCDTAVVTKERLEEIVGKDRFLVNNLLDGEHQPRNIYDILRDARSLLGLEMPYCIMRGNCEHFVTELRYGRAESRQVCMTPDCLFVPVDRHNSFCLRTPDQEVVE